MRMLRVKEVAQARGFTIARLERTAGIDIKTVRSIWHNPRHNASFETLEKIAVALGVPVTILIEDDEAPAQIDLALQSGTLDEVARSLHELNSLVRAAQRDRNKRLQEPSPTYKAVSSDDAEHAKNKLQALLPEGLRVIYVPEYHANGIFASDVSAAQNGSDANYPVS